MGKKGKSYTQMIHDWEQSMNRRDSRDAFAHVDRSTEDMADQERQAASRADIDSATYRERVEEGRAHNRSDRDRGTTGGT